MDLWTGPLGDLNWISFSSGLGMSRDVNDDRRLHECRIASPLLRVCIIARNLPLWHHVTLGNIMRFHQMQSRRSCERKTVPLSRAQNLKIYQTPHRERLYIRSGASTAAMVTVVYKKTLSPLPMRPSYLVFAS